MNENYILLFYLELLSSYRIIHLIPILYICSLHSGGISIQGSLKLDTDLVTDEVDFALNTEGLLHMHSDAEFATKIVLCMRIVFVDTNVT